MDILVSGSSGLIGSRLVPALQKAGHRVRRLVRSRDRAGPADVFWDPAAGALEGASLAGVEAAVHLGGESIASGRWTAEKKRRIRESRVGGTRLLAETLARLETPPGVFACASAIGFYGSRGPETLTEDSEGGSGFLAEVAREWEAATSPAAERGIRVVHLRFGVVLSADGGALKQMLPVFRLGGGGRAGSGRQYLSWISLRDAVGAVLHVLSRDDIRGPVNVVAPRPVTNAEFTRTLGRVLRRPTLLPVPAFAARLLLGEMADELLLSSARVEPEKLLGSEYRFQHADLESALRAAL